MKSRGEHVDEFLQDLFDSLRNFSEHHCILVLTWLIKFSKRRLAAMEITMEKVESFLEKGNEAWAGGDLDLARVTYAQGLSLSEKQFGPDPETSIDLQHAPCCFLI